MTTNDTNMIRSISWLSSGLVALLALASFSLSFESLRGLAIETRVVSPSLGWIFPLIVDGAIVVFSLSALRASLRKERTHWLRGISHLCNLWKYPLQHGARRSSLARQSPGSYPTYPALSLLRSTHAFDTG